MKELEKADNQRTIDRFGRSDYEYLLEHGYPNDVKKIRRVDSENAEAALLIHVLIKKHKLFVMDKETGVAWPATVVVGYKNGSLLIAHDA